MNMNRSTVPRMPRMPRVLRFKFILLSFLLGLFALFQSLQPTHTTEGQTPPPVRAEQPRPDIFECGNGCNMQLLNPVTVKAKATRLIRYRLQTEPSCVSGTIPADMVLVERHSEGAVGITLVRNDVNYDLLIRINCGTNQIRICGGINVFCLGSGFPYNPTVDISDVLSNWFPETRLAILLHEVLGHAIATWNEQYARCGASCGFASSPNWRDFMNTGIQSRHGFETIELERWERTMWLLPGPEPVVECFGATDPSWGGVWNNCTGLWEGPPSYPWDYNPTTGTWQDKSGASEWCCQQPYGGIYNRRLDFWTLLVPTTTWEWRSTDPVWRCTVGCP